MTGYTAVILADDKFPGKLEDDTSYIALGDIHGKPALDWVVGAVRASSRIKRLIVIGPEIIDELLCSRHIDRRLSSASAAVQQAMSHLGYAPWPDESDGEGSGLLFVHCGCVYLNPATVEHMIELFETKTSAIAFPLLPDAQPPRGAGTLRIVAADKKGMTVSMNAGFTRDRRWWSTVLRLRSMGGRGTEGGTTLAATDIADAEQKLSGEVDAPVRLLPLDDPSALQRIETPEDCRQAERRLPDPWRPRFENAKVILNPRSGSGKSLPGAMVRMLRMHQSLTDRTLSGHAVDSAISSYLRRFKIDAEIITPEKPASILEETRRCVRDSADLVIAAGGDGTINSVVNGLAFSGVPLGVIPLGTANVLAIELAVPPEIRSACQLLAQGDLRTIDLGKLNDRYFSCVAGIGFDAYISRHVEADPKLKRRFGGIAFLLIGAIDFFRYHFRTIELTIDNQPISRKGYLVLIGNGRHYGGDLVFSPRARMDDGLLDVVVFKSKSPLSALRYLFGFLRGSLPDLATVEYLQGKRISVGRRGNHLVQVDGESYGRTPVDIEAAPGALRVVS